MCFEMPWGSALPRMVGRGALLAAHSRLESTRSATSIAGPGIGGLLVRSIGAGPALVVDALSGARVRRSRLTSAVWCSACGAAVGLW